jgi:hypothetical protein
MSSKETRRNFEILSRIEEEKNMLEDKPGETKEKSFKGFAEGRSK